MLRYAQIQEIGRECGFKVMASIEVPAIELREEVRGMCEKCNLYNTSWACPPACGDLDSCRKKLSKYRYGVLVQTIGQLEDALDGESMMEAEERHRESFAKMYERLRVEYPNMLALGAGGCRLCKKCTYPDEPCRFPEKMTSSMEGYGMLVTQVCTAAGLRYYYGPMTIAYCGCFLLE